MNLRTEITSHSQENGSSDTEYSRGKGEKERIYPKEAKVYDLKLAENRLRTGAVEIVRAELDANPDVEALIQKIEQEIRNLKQEPAPSSTKLRLAKAKLERAQKINSENVERESALRVTGKTSYEKTWTPKALIQQNPRREQEMEKLSERALESYEMVIEQEKQELEQTQQGLTQAIEKKLPFWKTWPLKTKMRKLEQQIKDHQSLIDLKQRMDEQKEEEQELRKTG